MFEKENKGKKRTASSPPREEFAPQAKQRKRGTLLLGLW
jgi:hypothetical protein